MFQSDSHFFPSLKDIRDGLIKGQIKHLEQMSQIWSHKTKFQLLQSSYIEKWQLLFELESLGPLDQPLSPKILADPYHKITKRILYIYSMESFICSELNRASRNKDETKIQYYGPYAAALSQIIYSANQNLKKEHKLKGE